MSARGSSTHGRVLLVDDEPAVLRAYSRLLSQAGFEVDTASCGGLALELMAAKRYDALVTDIRMPDMSGTKLVELVRARGSNIPVVLVTGAPSVETAVLAVNSGAIAYLTKPVESCQLIESIHRAVQSSAAMPAREAEQTRESREVAAAIAASVLAFQPIVCVRDGSISAYEALLRPKSHDMDTPAQLIRRAEACGLLEQLGRHVRDLAASAVRTVPDRSSLFINLHPADLLDPDIYDPSTRLAKVAPRIVLELTERAALEDVPELSERIARLRAIGYRIAIDDLGAGYSSLSSLVTLEPEIVKLDMGLVRDIDNNERKRALVQALTVLAASLDIHVVAEGVETLEERDALDNLRVPLLQGYYFARPGPTFAGVPMDRARRSSRPRRLRSAISRAASGRHRL